MQQPFIAAEQRLTEITLPVIGISILLAIVLAASNAYLALKIGILTSASIPAAVLSMGLLRFIRGSNILQNNLVQTAASAGEAIAGGVVYTVPALIILHYWNHFPYLESVAIALLGGVLGVLISIPLRHVLVTDRQLRFPEGVAIAEMLIVGDKKELGLKQMLLGGGIGGLLELAQTGIKAIGNTLAGWWTHGQTVFGFGFGFAPALVGAGYLIGFRTGLSIFIGAVLSWGIFVPVMSTLFPDASYITAPASAPMALWGAHICYIGIGAMVTAGLWTLGALCKPLIASMRLTLRAFHQSNSGFNIVRTERDIPMPIVLGSVLFIGVLLFFLFQQQFSVLNLGLASHHATEFFIACVIYVLLIGFIAAAICGYFSGMVGVSATPGSGIVIASMLLSAFILRCVLEFAGASGTSIILTAEAVTIILGAVITGAACIANDNIQDLKVGHIVGATPWRQQIMLLLGAVVASFVIPPVMELLFNVYGIGGVFPRPGMDPSQMLVAPPAAMMAAVTKGVFGHDLPWKMLSIGAAISMVTIIINLLIAKEKRISVLGLATGVYLPWSSSTALFIGAVFALLTRKGQNKQQGILLACGLVAGAALMDVLLAIPMALAKNSAVLQFLPTAWHIPAQVLGVISIVAIGVWFYKNVNYKS